MRSEGGGFAANIYGAMPESRIQVTSHLRLLIPSHSSLATHPCFQTSGFRVSPWAARSLIVCERGGAGSIGSRGSTGVVRRIKIGKRRGVLEYRVFSYRSLPL